MTLNAEILELDAQKVRQPSAPPPPKFQIPQVMELYMDETLLINISFNQSLSYRIPMNVNPIQDPPHLHEPPLIQL